MFWYLLTIKPVVKRSFNGRKIGAIWPIPRPWLARRPDREEPPHQFGERPRPWSRSPLTTVILGTIELP